MWGAGPETIKRWYAKGYRTLKDLEDHVKDLNRQQNVGLKYYHEFEQRIPRSEVAQLEAYVRAAAEEVDSRLYCETCGSYRRGAETCGDIDILITHLDGDGMEGLLDKIVNKLTSVGFLTDHLSRGRHGGAQEHNKYMGVCHVPPPQGSGVHRRIDIQLIPLETWPFALLYFTGSGYFNRSMRLWARRHRYQLSDKGLFPKYTEDLVGPCVPCKTEKDIFDALGLDYKEPHERTV